MAQRHINGTQSIVQQTSSVGDAVCRALARLQLCNGGLPVRSRADSGLLYWRPIPMTVDACTDSTRTDTHAASHNILGVLKVYYRTNHLSKETQPRQETRQAMLARRRFRSMNAMRHNSSRCRTSTNIAHFKPRSPCRALSCAIVYTNIQHPRRRVHS